MRPKRWSVQLIGDDGRVFGEVARFRWKARAIRRAEREAVADVRWRNRLAGRWRVVDLQGDAYLIALGIAEADRAKR